MDQWEDAVEAFIPRFGRAMVEERGHLLSSDLDHAVDAGLLTILPHFEPGEGNDVPESNWLLWSSEAIEEFQNESLDRTIERLRNSSAVPLLDPWALEVARQEGLSAEREVREFAAGFGTKLLSATTGVRRASVLEILDLREELSEELINFRSAMFTASQEFLGTSADDADAWLDDYTVRVITPALTELGESVRSNSFMSELLDVVTDPQQLLIPGGLLIAATTGQHDLGSLVAAGLGLGLPLGKARKKFSQEHHKNRANKLYLLHRLGAAGS